jgi:glycosyltransferase involved in cell wall biosynthesis
MGTYNGARFIRQQLQSLAQQTLLPYELIVRDDASTDHTLDIVEEFAIHAPFPVRIHRNNMHLGYPDNFMQAAALTTGDWIAFCDQDDVWLSQKLERVVAAADGHSGVALVVHSAKLVDESLQPTGRRFPNIRRKNVIGPLQHSQIPLYPGFCCTFCRVLLDEVRWDAQDPRNLNTHDSWICFLANALGHTCYLPEALVLFRRHAGTVTGKYERPLLSATVGNATRATANDYRRYGQVISGYADLLASRSRETKSRTVSIDLQKASSHCARFASWLQLRAVLYETRGFWTRIRAFLTLVTQRAYVGRHGIVLGPRALVKDVIIALLGSSLIRRWG